MSSLCVAIEVLVLGVCSHIFTILMDNSLSFCTEIRTLTITDSRTVFSVHGIRRESKEAQIGIEKIPRENKKCYRRGITVVFWY